jgi:hypothetical protein
MRGAHGGPGGVGEGVVFRSVGEYLLQQLKLLKRHIVNFLVFLGLLRLGPVAQTRFHHPATASEWFPAQRTSTKRRD